ncbi:diguanylate cyclase [Devosia sp. PTR5]|uniref:diguanylate cyclase n=1 Tax=Devosia oryzisoli TaxID=2774138 RepID=A0A927IP33_9HYPH|nr:diguanylate cyclase [Devosia oryzisoli]MBD8064125.1 diguanylate cyclase [Devosia oryzisoli]
MWLDLLANFSAVGLTVSIWANAQTWVRRVPRPLRPVASGILMGIGTICTMLLSVELQPGSYFDLRTTLVGLSTFFGGPFSGLVTALIAAVYRTTLGGVGLVAGFVGIIASLLLGSAFWALRRKTGTTAFSLTLFTIGNALASISGVPFLPEAARAIVVQTAVGPSLAVTFLASLAFGTGMAISRRRGWLTHLLQSAVEQAPDYFYVKDRSGRIIAANWNTARFNNRSSPRKMIGLTDLDLAGPDRAAALFEAEQHLLRTGTPIVNRSERLPTAFGEPHTYLTSKYPILNSDGEVSGLVGVTKDFTTHETLLANLESAHKRLDMVLNHTSDGIAYFDAQGKLVLANPRYRELFPITGYLREPGRHLGAILRAVYRTGEQANLPESEQGWIENVLDSLVRGGEQDIQLSNGTWLLIRTSPLPEGGAVVVVSDITHLKRAETELAAVAEQFRILASVDALTGLKNRRSMVTALESEYARSLRSHAPLSFVLIDVDWFKRFNDLYGHPAGDACLRMVADRIRHCVQRPSDLAARYGGEEFVLVLPQTDAEGARAVVAAIQDEIRTLQIAHEGSTKGHVTCSAGIATFTATATPGVPMDLLDQADKALYAAKDQGRDTALHWQDVAGTTPLPAIVREAG